MANADSDSDDYVVEDLVERKFEDGEEQFLVKWQNYPMTENTWEPRAHLEANCKLLIAQFERKVLDQTEEVKEIDNVREHTEADGSVVRLYHVIWGDDQPSWEPEQNLRVTKPCAALVDRFDQKQNEARHLLKRLMSRTTDGWSEDDFKLADGHALDFSKLRKALSNLEKQTKAARRVKRTSVTTSASPAAAAAAASAAAASSSPPRNKRPRPARSSADSSAEDATPPRKRARGRPPKRASSPVDDAESGGVAAAEESGSSFVAAAADPVGSAASSSPAAADAVGDDVIAASSAAAAAGLNGTSSPEKSVASSAEGDGATSADATAAAAAVAARGVDAVAAAAAAAAAAEEEEEGEDEENTKAAAAAAATTTASPTAADEAANGSADTDDDEYEVEEIVGSSRTQWFIKWKGYGHEHNTWESKSKCKHLTKLIAQFRATTAAKKRAGKK